MSRCLSREEEIERLLAMYGEDQPAKIMEALERQFAILHNRAQVLLALCGIIVTTTGFSGRIIAGTNPAAQVLIILGVSFATLAAIIVALGVLHLRWLTLQPGQLVREWLMTSLRYRDLKTNYYRAGLITMQFGLALYVAAIAVMLLFPDSAPPAVGVR